MTDETKKKRGRKERPADEHSDLPDILLHLVCRWEMFYQQRTGARAADVARLLRILYGRDVPHPTVTRHLKWLAGKGLVVCFEDTEYGAGKVWKPTVKGRTRWQDLMDTGQIPVVQRIPPKA